MLVIKEIKLKNRSAIFSWKMCTERERRGEGGREVGGGRDWDVTKLRLS